MASSYKDISYPINHVDPQKAVNATDREAYIAELEKLHETNQAIVTAHTAMEMAHNVLMLLQKYVQPTNCNIMLFNFLTNIATIYENTALGNSSNLSIKHEPVDYFFTKSLEECMTHIESCGRNKNFRVVKELLPNERQGSVLSIPLRLKSTVVGVLNLVVPNSDTFKMQHLSFTSSIALALTIPLHTYWKYENKEENIPQERDDWYKPETNEKIFRSLVKHAPNFIMIVDCNGIIKFINHAPLGKSVEELQGSSFFDFKVSGNQEMIKKLVEKVITTGTACSGQIPSENAEGKITWYETHLGPITHEGRIVAVSVISNDITQRKKIEEELQASETKFRELVDAIPYGVQINDCSGKITFSNKAHCTILQYTEEELTGKYIWDLLTDKEEAKKLKEYLAYLVKECPPPIPYFATNRTQDGQEINIQVHWTYQCNDIGEVTGFISIITDITHTKMAEASLLESEEKFRTFMESASDLMFIVDKNSCMVYVNNAMARTLQYEKEELLGKHATVIMKEKALFQNRHIRLEKQGKITFDDIWLTKHGKEIHGELKIVMMPTHDHKYAGARGVFRDITQRKINKDKISQLSMQLMESQEEERQRIAKDLHDSVIQSMLAAKLHFKMYENNTSENRELFDLGLKFIDKTNNELREICSNLYPSILNDIGLEAAIRWYAKNYLEINHIQVKIKFNACRDIAHNIKIHLYRITQELFSNIVKYSGADLVKISLFYENNNNFFLIVEDNGLGFDMDLVLQEKRGFGFSNIHQRAENMSCEIDIASSPGHGTRITIATKDTKNYGKNSFISC